MQEAQAYMCGQSPHIESQHLENRLKGLAKPNTKAYFALLGAPATLACQAHAQHALASFACKCSLAYKQVYVPKRPLAS